MKKDLIALVDVCDVAVDLHNETMRLAELNLPLDKIIEWDMFNQISEKECKRVLSLFDSPEFWKDLPPVPGVHDGIRALQNDGYRVVWVTSPWFSCPNWENIRRDWLNRHFGTTHHDVIFTSSKYLVKGDIFIDDRPKHVRMWQAANPNGEAWLFDGFFNRHFDWPRRGRWSKSGIISV